LTLNMTANASLIEPEHEPLADKDESHNNSEKCQEAEGTLGLVTPPDADAPNCCHQNSGLAGGGRGEYPG
jgi:hypothetical protein